MSEIIDPENIKYVLPLNAGCDRNGNGRRCVVFYDDKGLILDARMSDTSPEQDTRELYGDIRPAFFPQIMTTPSEIKRLIAQYSQEPTIKTAREKKWAKTLAEIDARYNAMKR